MDKTINRKKRNGNYHSNERHIIHEILESRKQLATREVTTEVTVQEAIVNVPLSQVLNIIREHFESQATFQASGFKIEKLEFSDIDDSVRVVFVKSEDVNDSLTPKQKRSTKAAASDFDDGDDDDDDA